MKLQVTGKVRYKVISGFGPFKKETWTEESFTVVMKPGDDIRPVRDVRLVCVKNGSGMEVEGNLKTQICYFGGFPEAEIGKRENFVMTSVRNIEFRGTIEVVA